ncbi:MAG: hypothetical protein RLZZ226_816 [Pseudomonadota bacterium]|jgi:hypothetical protein
MIIFLKVLVGLSILIFLIGLIKPKWILFWMKSPDRLTATTLALLLFMGAWTGIAKMTLKPKAPSDAPQHRSADDQNSLDLGRAR